MNYTANFTKIDMHVHTEYSADSNNKLERIDKFLQKNMDFGLAVTDHNTIEGAKILHDKYPDRIIIGSEIRTKQGEITGLFLKENIPAGRDINWTIDAIILQGGLVLIPHPTCRLRTSKLNPAALNLALQRADLIEVFNSRNVFNEDNNLARNLQSDNMAATCGSDAHTMFEMGNSYVEIPAGTRLNSNDFFNALMDHGYLHCKKSSILVHFVTKYQKYRYKRSQKKNNQEKK